MASLGFTGKKVYVYGLGSSGKVTALALLEDGADVYVWDDREANRPLEMDGFSRLKFAAPEEVDWPRLTALIKSPGIPMEMPVVQQALENNVQVLGDIDLLYRREPEATFIGITGTNGKSTTTALVTHVLERQGYEVACGGNIGKPALSLPELGKDGIYVLELSSFQLEMLQETHFAAMLCLNLTPDHLDRHGDMAGYLAAKMRIFQHAGKDDTKVMGVDQDVIAKAAATMPDAVTVSVEGKPATLNVARNGKLMQEGRQLADLSYFDNLPGCHNWQNIACAFALTSKWLEPDQFFSGVRTFVGLPHRMEKVREIGRIRCVNDSKATNGEAAVRALQSFDHVYWVVGGKPKDGGLAPCIAHLDKVRAAFVIGEATDDFAETLSQHVPTFRCYNMETAVREAYTTAVREELDGAHIVLAPACASYDQFNSFEHRGDVFASLCRQLQAPLEEVGKVNAGVVR